MKSKIPSKPLNTFTKSELTSYMQLCKDAGLEGSIFEGNKTIVTVNYYNDLLEKLLQDKHYTSIHQGIKHILSAIKKQDLILYSHQKHAIGVRFDTLEASTGKQQTLITLANRGSQSENVHPTESKVAGLSPAEVIRKHRSWPAVSFVVSQGLERAKKLFNGIPTNNKSIYDELARIFAKGNTDDIQMLEGDDKYEFEQFSTSLPHSLLKSLKDGTAYDAAVSSQRSGTCTSKSFLAVLGTYLGSADEIKILKAGLKSYALSRILAYVDCIPEYAKDHIYQTILWQEKSLLLKKPNLTEAASKAIQVQLTYAKSVFNVTLDHNDQTGEQIDTLEHSIYKEKEECDYSIRYAQLAHKAFITDGFWENRRTILDDGSQTFESGIDKHDIIRNSDNFERLVLPKKTSRKYLPELFGQFKRCMRDSNDYTFAIDRLYLLIKTITSDKAFQSKDNKDFIDALLSDKYQLAVMKSDVFDIATRVRPSESRLPHTSVVIGNCLSYLYLMINVIEMTKLYARHHDTLKNNDLAVILIDEYMQMRLETKEACKFHYGHMNIFTNTHELERLNQVLCKKLSAIKPCSPTSADDISELTDEFTSTKHSICVLSKQHKNVLADWSLGEYDNTVIPKKSDETTVNKAIFNKIQNIKELLDRGEYPDRFPIERRPYPTISQFKKALEKEYLVLNPKQLDYYSFEQRLRYTFSLTGTHKDKVKFLKIGSEGLKTLSESLLEEDLDMLYSRQDAGTHSFETLQSGANLSMKFQIGNKEQIAQRQLNVCAQYDWKELSRFITATDILSSDKSMGQLKRDTVDTNRVSVDDVHRYLITIIAALPFTEESHGFADELIHYITKSQSLQDERLLLALKALSLYFDHLTTQKVLKDSNYTNNEYLTQIHTIVARYLKSDHPMIQGAVTTLLQNYLLWDDHLDKKHNASYEYRALIVYYHYLYAHVLITKTQLLGKNIYKNIEINKSRLQLKYHNYVQEIVSAQSTSTDRSVRWRDLFEIPYERIVFDKGVLKLYVANREYAINMKSKKMGGIKHRYQVSIDCLIEKSSFFNGMNMDHFDMYCEPNTHEWQLKRKHTGYVIRLDENDNNVKIDFDDRSYTAVRNPNIKTLNKLLLSNTEDCFYGIANDGWLFIGDKNNPQFVVCDPQTGQAVHTDSELNCSTIVNSLAHKYSRDFPILEVVRNRNYQRLSWFSNFDLWITTDHGELTTLPGYRLEFATHYYMVFADKMNKSVYIVKDHCLNYDEDAGKKIVTTIMRNTPPNKNNFYYHYQGKITEIKDGDHLLKYAFFATLHNIKVDVANLRKLVTNDMAYSSDVINKFARMYFKHLTSGFREPNDYAVALFIAVHLVSYSRNKYGPESQSISLYTEIKRYILSCTVRYFNVERKISTPLYDDEIRSVLYIIGANPYAGKYNYINGNTSLITMIKGCNSEQDVPHPSKNTIWTRAGWTDYLDDLEKRLKYEEKSKRTQYISYVSEPSMNSYSSRVENQLVIQPSDRKIIEDLSYVAPTKNTISMPNTSINIKKFTDKIETQLTNKGCQWESITTLPDTKFQPNEIIHKVNESVVIMTEKFKKAEADKAKVQKLIEEDELLENIQSLVNELEEAIQSKYAWVTAQTMGVLSAINLGKEHNNESIAKLAVLIFEYDTKIIARYRVADVAEFKNNIIDMVVLKTEQQHWQRVIQSSHNDLNKAADNILRKRAYALSSNPKDIISYLLLELARDIRLTDGQVNLCEDIYQNNNAMVSASIGSGKTTVFPALIHKLALSNQMSGKQSPVVLLLPDNLISVQGAEIAQNYTQYYHRQMPLCLIEPALEKPEETLRGLLDLVESQSAILTTRTSIQGLKNTILMANPNEKDNDRQIVSLGLDLLRVIAKSRVLCDELDGVFDYTTSVIIGMGSAKSLDTVENRFFTQLVIRAATKNIISTDNDDTYYYPASTNEYEKNIANDFAEIANSIARDLIKHNFIAGDSGNADVARLINLCLKMYLPNIFNKKHGYDWGLDRKGNFAIPLDSGSSKGLHYKDMYLKVLLTIFGFIFYEPERLIKIGNIYLRSDFRRHAQIGNIAESMLAQKLMGKLTNVGLDLAVWKQLDAGKAEIEQELKKLTNFLMADENKAIRLNLLSHLLQVIVIPNIVYPEHCLEQTGPDFAQLGAVAGCTGTATRSDLILQEPPVNKRILSEGLLISHIWKNGDCKTYSDQTLFDLINDKTQMIVDPTQQEESSTIDFARKFLTACNRIRSSSKKLKYVIYFDTNHNTLFAIDPHQSPAIKLSHTAYRYLTNLLKCNEHQWGIVMDSGRSRGTDIRLPSDAHGVVAISQHIDYNGFLQAVGRLRLMNTQKVTVALTEGFVQDITDHDQDSQSFTTKALIEWLKQKEQQHYKLAEPIVEKQREASIKRRQILSMDQMSEHEAIAKDYKSLNDTKNYMEGGCDGVLLMILHQHIVEKQIAYLPYIVTPDYPGFKHRTNELSCVREIDGARIFLSEDLSLETNEYPIHATRSGICAIYCDNHSSKNWEIRALSTRDIKYVKENKSNFRGHIYYLNDIIYDRIMDNSSKLSEINPKLYRVLCKASAWLGMMSGHFDQSSKEIADFPTEDYAQDKEIYRLYNSYFTIDDPLNHILERKLLNSYDLSKNAAMYIQAAWRERVFYKLRNTLINSETKPVYAVKYHSELAQKERIEMLRSLKDSVIPYTGDKEAGHKKQLNAIANIIAHTNPSTNKPQHEDTRPDMTFILNLSYLNKIIIKLQGRVRKNIAKNSLDKLKVAHNKYKSKLQAIPKLTWYGRLVNKISEYITWLKASLMYALKMIYTYSPVFIKRIISNFSVIHKLPYDSSLATSFFNNFKSKLNTKKTYAMVAKVKSPINRTIQEFVLRWVVRIANVVLSTPMYYAYLINSRLGQLANWSMKSLLGVSTSKKKQLTSNQITASKPAVSNHRRRIARLHNYAGVKRVRN